LRDGDREVNNPLSRWIALAIATGGGVGFIPLAPGTFGSVVGVFLFFPLSSAGLMVYFVWVAALSALGVWAAGRAEEIFDRTDDGRIVIDEVVGQLIALTPLVALCRGGRVPPFESDVFFLLIVTGFVTFRVLDIYKPGVIRWTERNISGGAGVMADDCVAGVLGAVGLAIPTAGILWWGLERGLEAGHAG
jgi:phosphatidylglycerophosphatase A